MSCYAFCVSSQWRGKVFFGLGRLFLRPEVSGSKNILPKCISQDPVFVDRHAGHAKAEMNTEFGHVELKIINLVM